MALFNVIDIEKAQAIKICQEALIAQNFIARHRQNKTDFSRTRRLPFALVASVILRNSVKSLQLVINETMNQLNQPPIFPRSHTLCGNADLVRAAW